MSDIWRIEIHNTREFKVCKGCGWEEGNIGIRGHKKGCIAESLTKELENVERQLVTADEQLEANAEECTEQNLALEDKDATIAVLVEDMKNIAVGTQKGSTRHYTTEQRSMLLKMVLQRLPTSSLAYSKKHSAMIKAIENARDRAMVVQLESNSTQSYHNGLQDIIDALKGVG